MRYSGCSVFELGLELFNEVVDPVDEHDHILKVEFENRLHPVFCAILGDDQVGILGVFIARTRIVRVVIAVIRVLTRPLSACVANAIYL